MGNNLYQEIDHDQILTSGIFDFIFKTKCGLLQRYFHKDTSNQIQPLGLYRLIIHLIPLFFFVFLIWFTVIPMKISHTIIDLIGKLF